MNPFSVSPETDSEARNQTALFAWLAMCGHYGRAAADDERCYTVKGYASAHYTLATSRISEALSLIYAVPNGSNQAGGARAGATARGQGLRPGIPDVCVPVPIRQEAGGLQWFSPGMYLELKTPTGRLSPEQKTIQEKLKRAGHVVTTEVGWINSKEAIARYLQL